MALDQRHAGLALQRRELLGHRGRRVGQRLGDGGHGAALMQLAQQPQAADVEHEAELIDDRKKCVMDMKVRSPHHQCMTPHSPTPAHPPRCSTRRRPRRPAVGAARFLKAPNGPRAARGRRVRAGRRARRGDRRRRRRPLPPDGGRGRRAPPGRGLNPAGAAAASPHSVAAATAPSIAAVRMLDTGNGFVDSVKRVRRRGRASARSTASTPVSSGVLGPRLPAARRTRSARRACCTSSRRTSELEVAELRAGWRIDAGPPEPAARAAGAPRARRARALGRRPAAPARAAHARGSRPTSRCSTGAPSRTPARGSAGSATRSGGGSSPRSPRSGGCSSPRRPARASSCAARAPGDLGWVVRRNGELYAEEHGWNAEFEALVARIVADFAADARSRRARRSGSPRSTARPPAACSACARPTTVAKLRLLLVEPRARGLGLGARLVDECVALRAPRRLPRARAVDERHARPRAPHLRAGGLRARRRGAAPLVRPRPRRPDLVARRSRYRCGVDAAPMARRPATPEPSRPLAPAARWLWRLEGLLAHASSR